MFPIIEKTYKSTQFQKYMDTNWFMNFVIDPAESTTIRTMKKIVLPELTDIGWVYVCIANVFEDKLSTAERIVLGHLLSGQAADILALDIPDRDRRELLNALLALQQYTQSGQSNVLLPLDMATSALILMSAIYRCTKTMEMVGLCTQAKTVEEQLREPVSDSYTCLYQEALNKLPPAARKTVTTVLSRDQLKKHVIMPDYYGSTSAIERLPEELREPYLLVKEELIPAQMRHLDWGKKASTILQDRNVTHPQWLCNVTGRNIGYICTEIVHADITLMDGTEFSVSKTVEGKPYHLPLIANIIHSADSSILVAWYEFAEKNGITTFTTHDAVNTTANYLNQMRQIIAEQIVTVAWLSPVTAMSQELNLPLPVIGDFNTWAANFKPHNFMS